MDKFLIKRKISDMLERMPFAYTRAQAFRLRGLPDRHRVITKKPHMIVIEGFRRCANSFAVRAFQSRNDPEDRMKIATYSHSPATVFLGIRWNIPTLVLIRDPDDAIPSLLGLSVQLTRDNKLLAGDHVVQGRIRYWTRRYTAFYSQLMPVSKDFVVGEFSEVTRDFTSFIEALNDKFGSKIRGLP